MTRFPGVVDLRVSIFILFFISDIYFVLHLFFISDTEIYHGHAAVPGTTTGAIHMFFGSDVAAQYITVAAPFSFNHPSGSGWMRLPLQAKIADLCCSAHCL